MCLLVSSAHKIPQISCRILHFPAIHCCALLCFLGTRSYYIRHPCYCRAFCGPSAGPQKSALIMRAVCAFIVSFISPKIPSCIQDNFLFFLTAPEPVKSLLSFWWKATWRNPGPLLPSFSMVGAVLISHFCSLCWLHNKP